MKPNEKQLKIIEAIEQCCKDWKQSNDINSPSHYLLIGEEVEKLELDYFELKEYIEINLSGLYNLIKKSYSVTI